MKATNYSRQYGQSWALVIGVNEYQHTNPLAIARADAESIADILVKELGFPREHVTELLDHDATRTNIMKRFMAFQSLSPDDRLIVFFAGHGTTTEGVRGPIGYLVPVDGNLEDKSTLIRWDELTRNADIIPAKHILFVMDACYSGLAIQRGIGAGEQRFITEMLQRFSRQVITAGKKDEVVADGGGPTGQNSIFTGYLLEGLRGKASDNGILTANLLMNYVYQKVGSDARSNQTPHFGHLDGDGDFVLRSPHGEHLRGGPEAEYLVKPVVERPEPVIEPVNVPVNPVFAEKNGYSDPESDVFGSNEWTKNLGAHMWEEGAGRHLVRPACWLSLVVEPVSHQPINLAIGELAQSLPNWQLTGSKPYQQFTMPSKAITTASSVVLFDLDDAGGTRKEDCWKRFLRIQRTGAMEYAVFENLAGTRSPEELASRIKFFAYVRIIGTIWTFIYAAKEILEIGGYQLGVRFLVNLVGTKHSVLVQFAEKPGPDRQKWRDTFDRDAIFGGSLQNWKCRDQNLQIPFRLVMGSLNQAEAKKIIIECAERLGLAYNHQSQPRCFVHGTDEFPWEQYHRG